MVAEGGYKNMRHARVRSQRGQQWDYVDTVCYYTVE